MSRMKGFVFVWAFLALVGLCFGNVPEAAAQKPVKIKFAGVFPPPEVSAVSEIAKKWQEEVTQRTKGAITFENYWGASLGSPAEHIELLKTGVVQAIQTHEWYTPTKMPFADFEWVFPFGPTDHALVYKAKRELRSEFPQFAKELAGQNAILMMGVAAGEYYFASKTPLRNLDDFKGTKVALIGRYFGRWLPPGTTAVVRPMHERYELLKSGVAGADLSAYDNFYAFKLYEVTQYLTKNLPVMTGVGMPVLMNLATFNKFSPEVQKILLNTGKDLELGGAREITAKWRDKIFKTFQASGMKFVEDFPAKDREKWIAALEDIPAEWAAEMEKMGLPGFALVKRWQEITTGLGYKWPRQWGIKK